MTNVNPTTGIRYGIIRADALDPEVINDIQSRGRDVKFEEARKEMNDSLRGTLDDYLPNWAVDDVAQRAWDLFEGFGFDDEPVHEFEIDGVKGRTTWLGGALMVFILESPFLAKAHLCSPCVPNCGNLDDVGPFGADCYDVPADWRYEQ